MSEEGKDDGFFVDPLLNTEEKRQEKKKVVHQLEDPEAQLRKKIDKFQSKKKAPAPPKPKVAKKKPKKKPKRSLPKKKPPKPVEDLFSGVDLNSSVKRENIAVPEKEDIDSLLTDVLQEDEELNFLLSESEDRLKSVEKKMKKKKKMGRGDAELFASLENSGNDVRTKDLSKDDISSYIDSQSVDDDIEGFSLFD